MMNLRVSLAVAATFALISFPAQVITGQNPDNTKAVKPIGKAPALSENKPIYFSDDFSGSRPAPEWKLEHQDAQRWTMQPKQKSLLVITQTGALKDSNNLKNLLILSKELPGDDFEAIVEASIQIEGVGNYVGLALFSDDHNYFWVGFQGDNYYGEPNRTPHFTKVFQEKDTDFAGEARRGRALQPELIFLKIEHEGNQFSGFYAYADKPMKAEEVSWVKLGTLPWINFHGKLALVGANYKEAPEVSAEFHSVLIRRK